MNYGHQLLPATVSSRVTKQVRYYTRKLAEIERFVEQQGFNIRDLSDQPVTVHRYWQP